MSTIFKFEGDSIHKVRQQALAAWQEQVPEDTPQGWSKSPVDFSPFLAAFPGLRLKAGFVLQAYQFRERNDANGKVWAMPENTPLPDPDEFPAEDIAEDPPHPPAALDDLMAAITGDGSAWAYLSASLFAREIAEFGAFGHGQYWSACHILAGNPWDKLDPSPVAQPTGTIDEWRWSEPEPSDWSPTVSMDNNTVTVTFYTFCSLGDQRITRHIDTYTSGKYSFITDEQLIARGPQGFVW